MRTAVLRHPPRRMPWEPRERTHAADPGLEGDRFPAPLCQAAGGGVMVVDREFDPDAPDACPRCAALARLLEEGAA